MKIEGSLGKNRLIQAGTADCSREVGCTDECKAEKAVCEAGNTLLCGALLLKDMEKQTAQAEGFCKRQAASNIQNG
jgi:hypothetical protein